ncbi:MAG: nucleotide-binding protein [Candidatus Helarchaeota archaeon]
MGIKIAVTGKGGVGKTTIAGTLARLFRKDGRKVLAIDNDPAMNLYSAIGIKKEEFEKSAPISEQTKLIESRTALPGGAFKVNPKVEDIPERFSITSVEGIKLIKIGTVETGDSGCMCPGNAFIKALLNHLILDRDEIVILDMEAGVEHLGRGTAKYVDIILIVVEPGRRSIDIAKQIKELAISLKVESEKIFIIGNKISNQDEEEFINNISKELDIEILGILPYDRNLIEADLKGIAILDYKPDSKLIQVLKDIKIILETQF